MSQTNDDETSTLRERLGGTVRAVLSRSSDGSQTAQQDGQAEPQARDKRPILIGSREHTEEPDQNDIQDWIEAYKENPLIRVPVQNFSSDVLEPGASVSLDPRTPTDDDVEAPTVPQDYPEEEYRGLDLDDALECWLTECYVDGWDFDADATDLLEAVVKDRRGRRGTAIVEHAWDDPTERQRLLALRPIKTETVTAYTREGKNIVLRPDDEINDFESVAIEDLGSNSREKAPTTPAGKTAALAQYDDVFGADERDEIPFALDDISVSAYDADTGALFGRPDTATVVDRAQAVRKKLEHVDQAILNTAFANIIAKVDTDDRELAKKIRDDLSVNSPETVSGTNVPTEITELEGTVPDAVEQIQQEIEYVLAAMPTPLYRVGFAGDINRDITTEQREDYRDEVSRERRRLEADFQGLLEQKAREFLYGDAHSDESLDVVPRLQIRPADAESPLRDEEFDPEAFATLMNGLSTAAGPKGGADTIIPKRVIVDTFLDMDADEVLDEDGDADMADLEALDESDPRVREAFEQSVEKANLTFDQPRDDQGRFAETQGSFDHTPTTTITQNTRIRLGIDAEKGELKRFLAQLEHDFGDGYEAIARSDHNPPAPDGHDVTEEGAHIDIVREGEKVDSMTISKPVPPGDGLRKAQDYLNDHVKELIGDAEEWKTANLSRNSVRTRCGSGWKRPGTSSKRSSASRASSSDPERPSVTLAEGEETHVFGPAVNTKDAFYRLDPGEAFCEHEGEVFDQFDEAETDDVGRRLCPFCGEQLQDYDKAYNAHLETRYSEGDTVSTPDGDGVVVEIRTEDFEGPDGDVGASDDSPAYVVATEDGAAVFRASDLEATTIEVDVEDPEAALAAGGGGGGCDTCAHLQDGHFEWPESWEESDTPARVIALKAWAGLGGQFTTCRREMAGEIASPSRFCAAFKDRVMGGWEGWRQGG